MPASQPVNRFRVLPAALVLGLLLVAFVLRRLGLPRGTHGSRVKVRGAALGALGGAVAGLLLAGVLLPESRFLVVVFFGVVGASVGDAVL
jgi:hypothetical protein